MSDRAVESLIEVSVGAVLATDWPADEKRQMIRALYDFHDRFDTSFTMLRHLDGLLDVGFEEPTPETGLVPEEASPDWTLSELALRNAKLSSDGQMALDWYAGLVSRYLEFDFDGEFLTGIESLEADSALHELRELAVSAGIPAYRKSNEALFHLPSWASERDTLDATDMERYHIARYLLDPKATMVKIRKAFEKDRKANSPQARAAFYSRIEAAISPVLTELEFTALARIDEADELRWFWYRDRVSEEGSLLQRELVQLTLDLELGGIEVRVGVQNGEVLSWQQSEPATEPSFWHFYSNLFADIEQNSDAYKTLNNFGLWPIKPGMAEKTEAKRLQMLAEQILILAPRVFELYHSEFQEKFFDRPLSWFEEKWEDVVPTEALVSFLGDVSLLRAYKARSEGDEAKAQECFEAAEITVANSHPKGALRHYLEPKVKAMLGNPEEPLSLMMHAASIKYLRAQMSG